MCGQSTGLRTRSENRELSDFAKSVDQRRPDLHGPNLSKVNLTGFDFTRKNFSFANLAGDGLTESYLSADLWGTTADPETEWPEGFDPIAAGVIFQ